MRHSKLKLTVLICKSDLRTNREYKGLFLPLESFSNCVD